jgi:hypothetical protein
MRLIPQQMTGYWTVAEAALPKRNQKNLSS